MSAMANAEICKAEAELADVQVSVGPNANTGASIGVEGASVKFWDLVLLLEWVELRLSFSQTIPPNR